MDAGDKPGVFLIGLSSLSKVIKWKSSTVPNFKIKEMLCTALKVLENTYKTYKCNGSPQANLLQQTAE